MIRLSGKKATNDNLVSSTSQSNSSVEAWIDKFQISFRNE